MKYPQSLFAEKIIKKLPPHVKEIIDAPCGDGQTTCELAQHFPNARLIGADINKKNILSALETYKRRNIEFQEVDIHVLVDKMEKFESFCLINSLFLLPSPKKLLRKISDKLGEKGKLILIIPNPQSINFKRYQKIEPEVNNFILEREDYNNFFKKVNLHIISCEGIVRVPFYGRWDTKLLYPIRDRYLFWLENRSQSENYGYYLLVLSSTSFIS